MLEADPFELALDRFMARRTIGSERFSGLFRAQVVETNDPLCLQRVRFKCPDFHDYDLRPEDCPWAVAQPTLGGQGVGAWTHPCIGDWVWIAFERNHPYGPVWVGFATPTRRRYYPIPFLNTLQPVSLNEDGKVDNAPVDFDSSYQARDGRPMSTGQIDRYGHVDIFSAVGFFPVEHQAPPPPPDNDAYSGVAFAGASAPRVNLPDVKMIMRVSKYGNLTIHADQGYHWYKDGDFGEFTGDRKQDVDFEAKRWHMLLQVACEGQSRDHDRRGREDLTRYGHKFEMRDVGWAQPGPKPSKSRQGDFGTAAYLSKETKRDERWVKLRSKAGGLIQIIDIGADPAEDSFIKRTLLQDAGVGSDKEDVHWKDKDARQVRLVTRDGLKLVLDSRGSDTKDADTKETPRGNGVLLKGRRSGASQGKDVSGRPVGFYLEFNENDLANRASLGSPLGQVLELNDYGEFALLAVGAGKSYGMPWKGIAENEFQRKSLRSLEPLTTTHHLYLDHENELIRLKSRSGRGQAPDTVVTPAASGSVNQGLEIHDGTAGDGPWVELVDIEGRGVWMTKDEGLTLMRGRAGSTMSVAIDDKNSKIIIFNGRGKVQIRAQAGIELSCAGPISVAATGVIALKSDTAIVMEGGGIGMTLAAGGLSVNGNVRCNVINGRHPASEPGGGAGTPAGWSAAVPVPPEPTEPTKVEPTDRGKLANTVVDCPDTEIEHRL